LIKRQTGWCAPAGPLLNVSHLSPGFTTTEPAVLHAPTYVHKHGLQDGKSREKHTAGRIVGNEAPLLHYIHGHSLESLAQPTRSVGGRYPRKFSPINSVDASVR